MDNLPKNGGADDIETILKDRGEMYGPFEDHARITQELKAVVYGRLRSNEQFNAAEHSDRVVVREGIDMICHKLGRIVNGDPFYNDSWDDIAGYARLVSKHIDTIPPF